MLDDEATAFLNAFMEEELGGRMNHPGKKLNKKKEDRRRCWRNNNKRNVDLYSIYKATDRLVLARNTSIESLIDNRQESLVNGKENFTEDQLIDSLDAKRLNNTRNNSNDGDSGN